MSGHPHVSASGPPELTDQTCVECQARAVQGLEPDPDHGRVVFTGDRDLRNWPPGGSGSRTGLQFGRWHYDPGRARPSRHELRGLTPYSEMARSSSRAMLLGCLTGNQAVLPRAGLEQADLDSAGSQSGCQIHIAVIARRPHAPVSGAVASGTRQRTSGLPQTMIIVGHVPAGCFAHWSPCRVHRSPRSGSADAPIALIPWRLLPQGDGRIQCQTTNQ